MASSGSSQLQDPHPPLAAEDGGPTKKKARLLLPPKAFTPHHVFLCSTPNCNWFAEGVPSPELDRELEEHLSTPHQDPTPAAARHTASGNGRHRIRIVSKEQVVVLLILIAYIECTTALTRTFNFCLIISLLILI
jgi:predicted small metal-binding protein